MRDGGGANLGQRVLVTDRRLSRYIMIVSNRVGRCTARNTVGSSEIWTIIGTTPPPLQTSGPGWQVGRWVDMAAPEALTGAK